MAVELFHINPKTSRTGVCRAKDHCPFGSDSPHFASKEAAETFKENEFEEHYGLFGLGQKQKNFPLDEISVRKRLNTLPRETLEELVKERFKRSGYSAKEIARAMKKNEEFYVYYSGNQEITLDPDDFVTEKTFTYGACSVLAAELHRATGWPIVAFTDPNSEGWRGHMTVKAPNGEYVDISGPSKNPTRIFGGLANDWVESEITNDELTALVRNKKSGFTDYSASSRLELLERFAVAELAYIVLERHGFIQNK